MVSRTMAMTPRAKQKVELENFPCDVRSSYKVLLPKFNALKVVIDEQKRNTRDILGKCVIYFSIHVVVAKIQFRHYNAID